MRILIADDHEIARVGIRRTLVETRKFEMIAEACNGTELREALNRTPFDFLIMDVSMPDFEPLREIQSIKENHAGLYILVVSAYDDDAYVQGLLSAGVHGYHLKGQPIKDLTRAIDQILAGEIWLSSPLINRLLSQDRWQTIELSPRQIDIARGLSNGLSNKEIAEKLILSIKTIENHLTRLYRQMNVNSRLEAVKYIHDNPQLLGQRGQVLSKAAPNVHITPSVSARSVIVVDDNERFRKQLMDIIGRNFPALTLYEAGNWDELHTIITQVCPTLIFLDVVLGDEDGISLTWRIRQEGCHTKVVLITAYPDREFHRMGIKAGAIALIDKKDLDTATIKQIVYDVIG